MREIEDVKRQMEQIRQRQGIASSHNGVPNHHPFANRQAAPHTPATSTLGGPRSSVPRQAMDCNDGFIDFEEFGEDMFMTPEARHEEYDRRNSLGGGSIFNAILAPVEANNTYMISSVTRESYSQVLLREITLDSVGPFMNQYLNIKRKHPGQAWMMVDFCSDYTKQELTVLADTYELPGATLGLGGAFALSDRQVLFLILEKLKARSMDDFVTRLQGMRFLEEESDLDYTKQYNYEKLFRAALNFRFRFVMRVQLLGSRAKPEHIPPLHKLGQTPGLLTYFFNAWPAGTGKALFSRHFTHEMRAQTDLKGFFKVFFAKLNAYRDVKQGYDDLGSVLSSQQRERDGDMVPQRTRDERTFVKREYNTPGVLENRNQEEHKSEQPRERRAIRPPGYDVSKRLWIPERERRDPRPRILQHLRDEEDEMDSFETSCLDRARNDVEQDQDEDLFFDERLQENEVQVMSAIEGDKANKKKGCFWKYMYGECTNKDCPMDHRDEVIQGMWKKKVWELAKAAKTPGSEVLVAELQRALRDAQAASNSNTRT